MKKKIIEKRNEIVGHYFKCPADKRQKGSLDGKIPVVLEDGKTVVYVSDEKKAEMVRLRFELQKKFNKA
ncbi:MAG: hypothetical protein WCL00_02285 [Bacteroidota bacterium]